VYLNNGALLAAPFDAASLTVQGPAVPLIDSVMQSINKVNVFLETGLGQFSISDTGTLAYLGGGIDPERKDQLVLLDRQGRETILPSLNSTELWSPRFSPDGKQIAYVMRRTPQDMDLWTYDIVRGTSNLTFKGNNDPGVVWSPDGTKLAFNQRVDGIAHLFLISADGNGTPQGLTASPYSDFPSSWSSAGLAFTKQVAKWQIWVAPAQEGHAVAPFLQNAAADLTQAEFSPDGKWIAYVSTETGVEEVYVRPYPGAGSKIRISTNTGQAPVWRKAGREILYYKATGTGRWTMMSVDVSTSPSFKAGTPRPLVDVAFRHGQPFRNYDVSPDGERFLVVREIKESQKPINEINFVLNWFEELKERVPIRKTN
jgi:serine/threonine-protein kinase